MRLYRVPQINDYREYRGNFILGTLNHHLAYLNAQGKIILVNPEVQEAVLTMFDMLADRPAIAKPTIGIDHFAATMDRLVSVASIERLVKALRA